MPIAPGASACTPTAPGAMNCTPTAPGAMGCAPPLPGASCCTPTAPGATGCAPAWPGLRRKLSTSPGAIGLNSNCCCSLLILHLWCCRLLITIGLVANHQGVCDSPHSHQIKTKVEGEPGGLGVCPQLQQHVNAARKRNAGRNNNGGDAA
ncbi:MAG: hypothetical protein DLM69_10240 [Candidatus Chloroheliales bacterium]|nr:MAG: hypothetical protein DLM69_10240 [Chloroflexota bacterium]